MGYQLDFGALAQYSGLFLEGTAVTLGLTAVASILGIAFGIAGAAASRSKHRWLRRAIAINLVIAWRIMLMTLLGREVPELAAEVLFSDIELRTLRAYAKKRVDAASAIG